MITETAIRNRIALLQARKTENGRIIRKLERKLRRLLGGKHD